MPRIEFYVLPDSDPAKRLKAACVLAMKAWRAGLPVFLRGSDAEQCATLDQLLWAFKNDCFVPHDLVEDDATSPVVIGRDQPPASEQGVLINLDQNLSPHTEQFARVIEIVNQQPELLQACRDNFRTYRDRGFAPKRVEL
ncbi:MULTISPECIES: DNA polymerase III subunit chi [Pseudomonas]|jgi:DNA polymerase-3 subunit chi|uniref:DNA polymerase III subunit chi n=1 Tax=Pseudomonas TaxID=286 RepID=UPI001562E27A|nr:MULTISPECIES: DNA polymerase III subunit chi [unclassified Pseudomonas]NRH26399.1 DNA polymerase III subunit chi [Pseudomonas sp. MS19]